MSKNKLPSINLLGYRINNCNIAEISAEAFELSRGKNKRSYMACANPHSLYTADRDLQFQDALKGATILLPDGIGIVLAAKLLNFPLNTRIAGSEFFVSLSAHAEKYGGLKYFFLGSTSETLERIVERLKNEFPTIDVCGTYSPPYKNIFDDNDNKIMIDIINQAKPDVLWVGMTAPKQEKWIFQNKDILSVPFMAAIGAVFDYYAGTKKRGSLVFQKLGLEWLPRLIREPKRVWKRMFVSAPIFIFWVIRERVRQIFSTRGENPSPK